MNVDKWHVSVLILACVLLSACAPAVTSVPTAVPSPMPTAMSATPTAMHPTATALPVSPNTTLSPREFKIPLSVSYGPDWFPGTLVSTWFYLRYRPANLIIDFLEVDDATVYLPMPGDTPTHPPFPDDFVGYLKSNAYFSDVTPPVSVSLGGANGIDLYAVGASGLQDRAPFLSSNTAAIKEFVYPLPQKYRFVYFPDISGKRLLIVAINDDYDPAQPGRGPLPIAQFDALMPKVQEVLDTITFNK